MFLEISQKFTGKFLCQSLSFKKVAGWGPTSYNDIFLGMFSNFQNIFSVEKLWTTSSKLFEIVSWNFPVTHLSFDKTNTWKHIFEKLSIFFKLLSWRQIFLLYKFSQILWNLIIYREIFLSSFVCECWYQ